MYNLILLLLSIVPLNNDITIDVDRIECNHMFDVRGRHVLDQLIFWKVHHKDDKIVFHVDGWLYMKNSRKVNEEQKRAHEAVESIKPEYLQIPYVPEFVGNTNMPQYKNDFYVSRVGNILIRSKSFINTITTYDPELYDREFLPKEKRNPLLNNFYNNP